MKGYCRNCNKNVDVGARVGWKLGVATAGVLLGRGTSKHPLGFIVGGLTGLAIGHAIDTQVLPKCPACQAALEVINEAVPA